MVGVSPTQLQPETYSDMHARAHTCMHPTLQLLYKKEKGSFNPRTTYVLFVPLVIPFTNFIFVAQHELFVNYFLVFLPQ